MAGQLQDRVAIVTGASNGIGRAIAEMFAGEGAKTVLVARRASVLDEVASGIRSRGGEALPVPTDVTQEDQVAALFEKTARAHGRLDILVNNAGVATHINTEDISLQYWREVLDINITAAFLCCREAIKIMKEQKPQGGRIINMGSISAKTPRPELAALHHDQVCHAGHDASVDHGRPQTRHRRVDHPSGLHAQFIFGAGRPDNSRRGRNARRLRHGGGRCSESRGADVRPAPGGQPLRSDHTSQPPALIHQPRLVVFLTAYPPPVPPAPPLRSAVRPATAGWRRDHPA